MGLLSLSASRRSFSGTTISPKTVRHCLRSRKQGRVLDQGFTLGEVIITVVIVGILASIAVPNFSNQVSATKDRNTKSAMDVQVGLCEESLIHDEVLTLPSGFAGTCENDSEFSLTSESGTTFMAKVQDYTITKEY